jgi:hypothetical protein
MVRLGQRRPPRWPPWPADRAWSPIGRALSLGDDLLGLDPAVWATTWRKGGLGPGVLALAYLATTRTGHSYVVTVLVENRRPTDRDRGARTILSAMKGAFTLAARR